MFFTTYRLAYRRNLSKIVSICKEYDVSCVGFGIGDFNTLKQNAFVLFENNIKIFCFSTDNIDVYYKLRNIGNIGAFTNKLKPSEIEGKVAI